MSRQFQVMQRRFGNARPGLQLLAVEEAALPVTMVRADVLALERKRLPVTEEFVLRYVHLGVTTPQRIAVYLGLEASHVLDAAAAQLAENTLRRGASGQLSLTAQGTEIVRDLVASQPVMQQLPVAFDRLTWSSANYLERMLLEKRHAEEFGMTLLPASRNASIGLVDITPRGMNTLLKDDRLQVLRVHKVAVRKHRYLPVKLLVYGDVNRGDLELAVCIDDELSAEHALALGRIDAVGRLGLAVAPAEPRPVLDDELESLRSTEHANDSRIEVLSPAVARSMSTSQVRSVSVFEHVDLLAEALQTAKRRILIVSPWIRKAVVNADFLAKLEERLRAGVSVTIAHGYGVDDRGSDMAALQRLTTLADRHKSFSFVRLRNTHAKILIFDDNWVSTSFNWLSFRGDPQRTYRMEEGTLVRVPSRVDKEHLRYLKMVEEQRSN